ncbi:acyloxyacyl hydrolase [Salibacter sp.]|uniref:acyloxyacyl hydrolase n=1 Tax=Salibacter sp. TaxID=2010995 RepID=UPI00286FBFC9|nr:acyloxyacyl hydrolase [Salibacter sp.]MDR9487678.1 acyloxyacyl hydrolase [Salibacter sp.]
MLILIRFGSDQKSEIIGYNFYFYPVKKTLAFILYLLIVGSGLSQSAIIKPHYGFTWPHRSSITHLVENHTAGLSLSFEKQVSGKQYWHRDYNFPSVGVSGYYTQLGNKDVLGYALGAIGYLKFYPYRFSKGRLYFKTGGGYGYISKKWNPESNHKNVIISSHSNLLIQLESGVELRLGDRLATSIGVGVTHFSNGSTTLPNKGVNYLAANVGLQYKINEPDTFDLKRSSIDSSRFMLNLRASGFYKEGLYELTGKKPVSTVRLEFSYKASLKSKITFGSDLMYNGTLASYYEEQGYESSNNFQAGTTVGYHLNLHKFEIFLHQGFYLYSFDYPDGRLYQRLGLMVDLSKGWFVNGSIKSHLVTADYFEIGIGKTLWRSN